nr:hypothetical protein [Dechloromonas sp.]
MADPLKVLRRLDQVTTDYTVFERDQVLTHDQLNGVAEYLDDQARLTRTRLLGVGIVDGLEVALNGERLQIGRGAGVTSDGDLLGLAADTAFDRYREYPESAPVYDPFLQGDKRLVLHELLAVGDRQLGQPLSSLPGGLGNKAVIAFMESYESDPDLCTGGDCDNLGKTARNSQRFLLLDAGDAKALLGRLNTPARLARKLPYVEVFRPKLGKTVVSASDFLAAYREAAGQTRERLDKALAALHEVLAEWRPVLFAAHPLPDWSADLTAIAGKVTAAGAVGIQYYHAFLADLAASWNELRDILLADGSHLCPPVGAFPKHLVLGDLGGDGLRTPHFPAPQGGAGQQTVDRVRFLLRRLNLQLKGFRNSLPLKAGQPALRIAPSRREDRPLGERAIPWYYTPDIRPAWTQRLGPAAPGYHWALGDNDDPLNDSIAGVDFFRIEGHLGMAASQAEPAIEALVRARNLPISVMSVLLHTERGKVWRGPRFKHSALHSLHYLLRQDVASQLKDNLAYVGKLKTEVAGAQSLDQAEASILKRPLSFSYVSEGNSTSFDVAGVVGGAESKVTAVSGKLVGSGSQSGLLQTGKYKAFASQAGTWRAELDDAVVETAKARESLGHIMRSDIASPIDAMVTSKSPLWVGWLDDIIKKRDEDKTERLLFSKMIVDHPGLEHRGGCVPGGTFVLAYDDQGTVVGDFMLPYWIDDIDEEEQRADPPLVLPDLRLPNFIKPIKVIKPLATVLDDYKVKAILPELQVQKGYVDFVQKSVSAFGGVIKEAAAIKTTSTVPKTGDDNMNRMFEKLEYNKNMAREMRIQLMDEELPPERRSWLEKQVDTLDKETAETVKATTEYFAVNAAPEIKTGAAAQQVYVALNESISQIGNAEVTSKLNTDLNTLQVDVGRVSASDAQLVGNVVKFNFKQR